MHVHVCAPQPIKKLVHAGRCPDCKKWTRFIGLCYEWYGASMTCLKCGREFADGQWMPLHFYRYARRDNIAAAKRHWRNAMTKELEL